MGQKRKVEKEDKREVEREEKAAQSRLHQEIAGKASELHAQEEATEEPRLVVNCRDMDGERAE